MVLYWADRKVSLLGRSCSFDLVADHWWHLLDNSCILLSNTESTSSELIVSDFCVVKLCLVICNVNHCGWTSHLLQRLDRSRSWTVSRCRWLAQRPHVI